MFEISSTKSTYEQRRKNMESINFSEFIEKKQIEYLILDKLLFTAFHITLFSKFNDNEKIKFEIDTKNGLFQISKISNSIEDELKLDKRMILKARSLLIKLLAIYNKSSKNFEKLNLLAVNFKTVHKKN
jgi:hypothetical protein